MTTLKRVRLGNSFHPWDLRTRFPDLDQGHSHREAAQVTEIIIHHDAITTTDRSHAADMQRIEAAYTYHTRNRKWPGIGYHLYIFPSGHAYYVGDWATVRFHTAGPDDPDTIPIVSAHNERAIAICLAGSFNLEPPPAPQLRRARAAVANIRFLFQQPAMPVLGHQDAAPETFPTDCPGTTWPQWKHRVN